LLVDPSPRVREQGLILAEKYPDDEALSKIMAAMINDADAKVRLQLACSFTDQDVLSQIIAQERSYTTIAASALISLAGDAPSLTKLASAPGLDAQLRREIARALPKADAAQLMDQWYAALSDHRDPGIVECLAESASHSAKMTALAREWLKSADTLPLALSVFTRTRPADAYELLTHQINERPPGERAQLVSTLLTHVEWTRQLLSSDLRLALDAQQRASLLQHPNKEIASLAAEVFQSKSTPTRAAVLEKFKPALTLPGDAAKGKQVFAAAGCIACHQLEGVGLPVGPDLRSVVPHTPEKLFNSILDPSAIIEPGFAAYHCTLKTGEQLYGIVATETSSSLTMKLPGNVVRSVLRSEISELKATKTSLMPDGLEATLTAQSLADLIAYLRMPKQ
jgi:putative heme-binding domain-containing protein